jgi:hypothetical protein
MIIRVISGKLDTQATTLDNQLGDPTLQARKETLCDSGVTLFRWLLAVCSLAALSPIALAQSIVDTDALRQQLASDLEAAHIGTGYAAIVDFAVSRDISSATFYPDDVDGVADPQLQSAKLPFRFRFGSEESAARAFLQGHVAYQTFEADLVFLPDERIGSRWRTTGGSLAVGVEIPVGKSLRLLPTAGVGYGRIVNRADYTGPIGQDLLRPVFTNLLFDWDADAFVYGASLGLDWRQEFRGMMLEILANASHHLVRSSSSSSEFVDFDGHVTVLDVEFNAVRPTSWSIGEYPLSLVALFGATGMLGPDRDALGFDKFFEAGLGLEADLSSKDWKVKSLRLGMKGIFGPDVRGWGLVIGYGF